MRFGILEILVIIIVIALFFGPKQIPKLTKAITDAMHSMKDEVNASKKSDKIEETVEENTEK